MRRTVTSLTFPYPKKQQNVNDCMDVLASPRLDVSRTIRGGSTSELEQVTETFVSILFNRVRNKSKWKHNTKETGMIDA